MGLDQQKLEWIINKWVNNTIMLARHEVKTPIILLLVLTALGELCLLGGVIQSGVGGYIGILMQPSSASLCSTYLAFKVEWLRTYMYNIIFFCACGATAIGVALLIVLLRLLGKFVESQEEQFPQFSLQTFYILYILYSLVLLLTIPSAGYYLTLFIEKGSSCTASYQIHWFAIGILFMGALFFLFVCWLYLFILKLQFQDRFQQNVDLLSKKLVVEVVMKQPTIANVLDLIMMEQRLKDQQEKNQIKEPLVESLDSDDQASLEEGQKEKIACVDFGEYKRKQQAQRMHEVEEQRIILELMTLQQDKRDEIERQEAEAKAIEIEKKKKTSTMALSPDDEDFDEIFEESEEEGKQNLIAAQTLLTTPSSHLQEPFYPANYVPVDQEDEKRFKQYKKRLLAKYNIKKAKGQKRHLQNIQGGRSKRQLMRAVNSHKKPPRTVQYYENMLKKSYVTPILEVQNSEYTSEVQENSATFNLKALVEVREQPSMMIIPEKQPELLPKQRYFGEEEEPRQRLVFEKRAEKSPMRKKLFDEQVSYLKNMSMGSVLGTLVKGVVESTHRTRLMQLRQEREGQNTIGKRKKNERLIDFIRSKYN